MSIKIRLTGGDPIASEDHAAALLHEFGEQEPERVTSDSDDMAKRDPATALAIASLVLALPGAILATMDIIGRIDRRRLKRRIETLKASLEESGCDGILEIEGVGSVDLSRNSPDAVVDLLLRAGGDK
jgi:hypothetical protein